MKLIYVQERSSAASEEIRALMRPITTLTILAAALLALAACAKSQNDGPVLRSSGTIIVNGPGVNGSVHANASVFYVLKSINQGQAYTLRTEIGLFSNLTPTTPDGTLFVDLYASEEAFRNNQPKEPVVVAALAQPNQNVYEAHFTAQAPSGDYVAVIRGASLSDSSIQFFFDLRLMSADPSALSFFATTTIPAVASQALDPGYLNIYNGGLITSDTYTISLASGASTTSGYPLMFVYKDSTLTLNSLMLSSIPTISYFSITRFDAGTIQGTSSVQDGDLISGVTITSGIGPFIVLRGMSSAATYTLTVGP